MIQFETYMIIVICMMFFVGISRIILGASGTEKSDEYGIGDIIAGIIWVALGLIYILA